jgi:hypothetical protein
LFAAGEMEVVSDQHFIISLGKVAFNSKSYELFLQSITPFVPDLLLQHFVQKLDNFAFQYSVPWAEVSFDKVGELNAGARIVEQSVICKHFHPRSVQAHSV